MDVENTIKFLVENAARHDARLAVIEQALQKVAESLVTLAAIAKEHRGLIAEMDAKARERDAKLDDRIDKLVSAIGALTRQPPR